ncbi:MAG: RHS repeat protein [Deltaproteobacteria bacterium]|nr:RHS repeat protein [Deltaproteobacteria bacterium]
MKHDPATGKLTHVVDANGLQYQFELRDGFGDEVVTYRPDGTFSRVWATEDSDSLVSGETYLSLHEVDSTGRATAATVDARGRAIQSSATGLRGRVYLVERDYSARGQLEREAAPHLEGTGSGALAEYLYDDRLRVVSIVRPGSGSALGGDRVARFEYDGVETTRWDADGDASRQRTDALGRVVESVDALGGTTRLRYGPFNTLERLTDPLGRSRIQTFDRYGRRLTLDDPDLGAQSFRYDALDQLRRTTSAKRDTQSMCYDALSRRISRRSPEGISTWSYDRTSKGRLSSSESEEGIRQVWAYDSLDRLESETLVVGGESFDIRYAFNPRGELQTIGYPKVRDAEVVTISRRYDNFGQLTQLEDMGGHVIWDWLSAGPSGQVASVHYGTAGSGTRVARDFAWQTGALDHVRAEADSRGGVFQDVGYSHDAELKVTGVDDVTQRSTESYRFDVLDRLTEVVGVDGVRTLDLGYDAVGNIKRKSDVGAYSYPYEVSTSSPRPYAVSTAGPASFRYDENGNQTSRLEAGLETTMRYSSRDMMKELSSNGTSYEYEYDADDQRVLRRTTHAPGSILYVDELYEREIRGLERHHRYKVHAPDGQFLVVDVDEGTAGLNTTERYVHRGRDGSPNVIRSVGADGAVSWEPVSFDAFGARRDPSGLSTRPDKSLSVNEGFTGHEGGAFCVPGRVRVRPGLLASAESVRLCTQQPRDAG